ncbi:MAG: hypothetical protein IKB77_00020 [Lentisphaeria bacterium]|nr:hypothetical protein [Lentisphaeria bacterium]
MTEILTNEISVMAGVIGILLSILLSIIIYELRALRKDLKEYVPEKFCSVKMKEHERRLEKLENRRNNQNNFYSRKGKN